MVAREEASLTVELSETKREHIRCPLLVNTFGNTHSGLLTPTGFEGALGEIDWRFAALTYMCFVELIRKNLNFFAASWTLAHKR